MGFARAGSADKDGIALGVQEGAGRQFTDLPLIDRRGDENEAVEISQHPELGGLIR